MVLKRSDYQASEGELQGYYEHLAEQHLTPLWRQGNRGPFPQSQAVPYVWHWEDLRPLLERAAELIGTQQAERRVLVLHNPGLEWGSVANTLMLNVQIVLPGEIARAHRHTNAALRFIVKAKDGYTVVNGERVPMREGDLVLTPSWSWHDHANPSDEPMFFLDGLDAPLVRMLECGFREDLSEDAQLAPEGWDPGLVKYSHAGLRPAWEPIPNVPHSPLVRYPLDEARAALDQMADRGLGSPYDGVILQYTNPVTGGPVLPTLDCYIQMLQPDEHTRAHRHTSCVAYHVVEGSGYTMVDGERIEWGTNDIFTVPGWAFHEHVVTSSKPAILFSLTDIPVKAAFNWLREEPHRTAVSNDLLYASGNLVFDAQIVAVCRETGVSALFTSDRGFDRFSDFRVERL